MDVPTSGPYRDIAVAQRRRSRVANQERSSTQLRGCAVAEGGALDCWGLEGSLPGTDESAAEVAVSSDIACLRTESGSVHCSGGGIEFPEGPYDDIDGRLQDPDSTAETDRIRRIRARLEARVRSGRRVREQTDGSERPPSPAVVWVHPESTARQVLRDVELVEQAVAKTPLRELQGSGVLLAVEKRDGERPSPSGDAPSWLSDRIERVRQLRWNASGRNPESSEWNRLLDDAFSRAVGDCEVARKFGASRFVSESSRFARDAQSQLLFGDTSRILASCGCDALDVPALRRLQFYSNGRWHRPITALRTGPDRDIGAHTYDPDASPLEVDVSADATLQGLIDALADAGFRGDRPVDVTFVDE